jgi:serpin B
MPRTSQHMALGLVCLTLLGCDAKTLPTEPGTTAGSKPPTPTDGATSDGNSGSAEKTATAGKRATAGAGGAASEEASISRSTVAPEENPSVPDADYAMFVAHLNKFGLDLGQAQATANGLTTKNIVYSPLSVSFALGMTYAGARGTTAEEMKRVLGDSFAADGFHGASNKLSRELASRVTSRAVSMGKERKIELSVADAVFVERTLTLEPEYLDLLGRQYDSGVQQADFLHAPEPARVGINRWVEQQTHDRIQELLPMGSIDESTRIVLVNAVYFYGSWAHPFTHDATRAAPFTTLAGSAMSVPTMNGRVSLDYRAVSDLAVADFPYEGNNLRMTIVLPAEGKFEAVRSQVSAAWLDQATTGIKPTLLNVALPKFTMTVGSVSLKEGLESVGMKEVFTAKANFSGMVQGANIMIADVLHKAFIAVDEDGTEAAAATAVIGVGTSAPIEQPIPFTVNRPFLFFIRDKNGIVLFSGQVVAPEP